MTIQEAIKSGRPFTRWDDEVFIAVEFGSFIYASNGLEYNWLMPEDILAEDWEVKETWR